MRLSARVDCALRAVVEIAATAGPLTAERIARALVSDPAAWV